MKEKRILLFAGTTEGRKIAKALTARKIPVTAFVATEYGEEALEGIEGLRVVAGRRTSEEMEAWIKKEGAVLVIDATHPYAQMASQEIVKACRNCKVERLRVLREACQEEERKWRESGNGTPDIRHVSSVEEAGDFLNAKEGNVLVTTGSKELKALAERISKKERLFPRVLPVMDSLKECQDAGIKPKNIIAMQGPFTIECNLGMLLQTQAKWLLTKESGRAGGYPEKLAAAAAARCGMVVIGRPTGDDSPSDSFSADEAVERAVSLFQEKEPIWESGACPESEAAEKDDEEKGQSLYLIGIGPGSSRLFSREAIEILGRAQVVFGAARMQEAAGPYLKKDALKVAQYQPAPIMDWLSQHPDIQVGAVLLSGDIGFYSGAKKLFSQAEKGNVRAVGVSGISSPVYFCGKLKEAWEDMNFVSLHGKQANGPEEVRRHRKSMFLMEGEESVRRLAKQLLEAGFPPDMKTFLGSRLSYEDESIRQLCLSELLQAKVAPPCLLFIKNEDCREALPLGLEDEAFVRGGGEKTVPMTKSEVRCVSLSKLMIEPDSLVYDIGAGTGSVSVEAALAAYRGHVWAIERKEEALKLIETNRKKFQVSNLSTIHGSAPEALLNLPAPDRAFIGGTSGTLSDCLKILYEKNSRIRVVINAVTLETLGEALEAAKNPCWSLKDMVMISVTKGEAVGRYHMTKAQNPVWIITLAGREGDGNDKE